MTKSSVRGIFLSLALLCLIVAIIIPINAYAAEIGVKSYSFEETTIIEFTNSGKEDVNSFRVWLGSDMNFKSFKTESGWTGEKTPQGVIIFTSLESVKPGESIKIGVKTDQTKPGINWKALDKNQNQIEIGKTIPGALSAVEKVGTTTDQNIMVTTLDNAEFKLIPEKPSAGSTVRVIGDNFEASKQYDIYLDRDSIGTVQSDENGHFITTVVIPKTQSTDRVDFSIKDKSGNEKKISLRIGEVENRIPDTEIIKLSVNGVPPIMHRGDLIEVSGTAQPNSGVTISIKNSDDVIINTRTANSDSKGNWKIDPITVPGDTVFGVYNAVISDGKDQTTVSWTVETTKTVLLAPIDLKFNPGDIMKFNGTALPNKELELILQDPLGVERFSKTINVSESGLVEFQYPTQINVDKEGTWTLVATQDGKTEFIYAGLGQLPSIPINAKFDKLNYKTTETANISLSGKPGDKVSLLIIDPSDKQKTFSDGTNEIPITLEQDGRKQYHLDLSGYSSGVYTAIITKANAKTTELFTVGLQAGSGDIKINTTKLEYQSEESILILGNTNPNALLTIELIDPDGNIVKSKDTFSDKNGKISFSELRIPTPAEVGKWAINVKSGPNFDKVNINVKASKEEGLVVTATNGVEIPGFGKSLDIKVANASGEVSMKIISPEGVEIASLSFHASSNGDIKQPWFIPEHTPSGTYTLKVTDATGSSAEATFIIN
ncbi:MAG: biofilm-associated protein [Nitrosarchaeum sp.]|nr:biofilm-associated protein [Nitrosarchaeum sp.]